MSQDNEPNGTPAARGRLRAFSKSLPMALLRAREAVMRQFRPSLNSYGITEQQWRVLRALTSVETIEILELARATFLLAPSLSRILKDLDDRKLVIRRASDTDLRRGLVSISPAGRSLIEMAGAHSEAIYSEITARFGPEKLRALHALLDELEASLETPVSVPGEDGAMELPLARNGRAGRSRRPERAPARTRETGA